MRSMGLDVGSRTIGVAVSDILGIIAQGVTTIKRTNLEQDLVQINAIIKEHQVDLIVVGLPLNMNGTQGDSCDMARKLGEAIGEYSSLPVQYNDERLTTVAASKFLIQADVSRKKRKQVIDKIAAVFILQNYLDRQQNSL